MPESIVLAIIAISSPLIVGLVKEFIAGRKAAAAADQGNTRTLEQQNEFLHRQLDEFRKDHEAQMGAWLERYETLRNRFEEEREKTIRLQTQLELGRMLRKSSKSKDKSCDVLDYFVEFNADAVAVVFADEDGIIVDASPRARAMFGYTDEEMKGNMLTMLMPEEYRMHHTNAMLKAKEAQESKVVGRIIRVDCLRKSGDRFTTELTVKKFQHQRRTLFAGIFREMVKEK